MSRIPAYKYVADAWYAVCFFILKNIYQKNICRKNICQKNKILVVSVAQKALFIV